MKRLGFGVAAAGLLLTSAVSMAQETGGYPDMRGQWKGTAQARLVALLPFQADAQVREVRIAGLRGRRNCGILLSGGRVFFLNGEEGDRARGPVARLADFSASLPEGPGFDVGAH